LRIQNKIYFWQSATWQTGQMTTNLSLVGSIKDDNKQNSRWPSPITRHDNKTVRKTANQRGGNSGTNSRMQGTFIDSALTLITFRTITSVLQKHRLYETCSPAFNPCLNVLIINKNEQKIAE